MAEIISHVFDDRASAENALRALERDGFASSEISILSHGVAGAQAHADTDGTATATGATVGGMAGAGIGVLASIGTLAIPGIGPLVAAGMLATTLAGAGTGAVVGGLTGALVDYGMSPDDADVYSEAIRRGGTLLTVTTTAAKSARAETILRDHGAIDIKRRREDYVQAGWSGYDPKAPALTTAEIERERQRRRM